MGSVAVAAAGRGVVGGAGPLRLDQVDSGDAGPARGWVLDRYWLLGELPGPRPEAWMDDLEPAAPGDERVAVLVAGLRALRWRMLTRTALCRQLVSALEWWSVRRELADIELGWLLDGDV
jgi:hypothetical protein